MGIGIDNYRDRNLRFPSIADTGGRRILGMGGSLKGYIETGDAYNNDYYIGSKSKSRYKKKIKIPDAIKALALTGGLIASVGLLKSGKVDFKNIMNKINLKDFINNTSSKIKNFNPKNMSFKKINISNSVNNLKSKLGNFKHKDKISNLLSKFKISPKKP